MPKASINRFIIYYLYYKEKSKIIEFIYNSFFWPLLKFLSLSGTSSDYIVKFTIHHLYYKDKLVGNLTWSFIYIANFFHFLCNLGNISAAFLLTCNDSTCIIELGLVTKKSKSLKTFLYLIFHIF